MRGLLALFVAAVAALAVAAPAHGYAEDVCPAVDGGGWARCSVQLVSPGACEGSDLEGCAALLMLSTPAAGISRLVLQAISKGARSTEHFDVVYLLAQAAGLTPRQAYWTAAYAQATDITQYVHLDQRAKVVEDPALQTAPLAGADRDNFVGGGLYLHFMAPMAETPAPAAPGQVPVTVGSLDTGAPPALDGLHPGPADARLPVLANARRWLYGKAPLCIAGLTNRSPAGDHATGDRCYTRPDGSPATVVGRIPFVTQTGELSDLTGQGPLGELQLTAVGAEHPVPASRIADITGAQAAPFARLGIYTHALGDRISHHLCVDSSYISGPRPADAAPVLFNPIGFDIYQAFVGDPEQAAAQPPTARPDFLVLLNRDQCDQTHHAGRHELETGRSQAALPPADRTTDAGIAAIDAELRAFAASDAGLRAGIRPVRPAGDAVALQRAIVTALEREAPVDRLAGLTDVAARHCLLPAPGYGTLNVDGWLRRADSGADDAPPTSRPTLLRVRGGRLTIRGSASDTGCAGVARVDVALARRDGRHCRAVMRTGTLGRRRSCAALHWQPARGTAQWSLRLPRRLPPGRYVARSRAVDGDGNAQAAPYDAAARALRTFSRPS